MATKKTDGDGKTAPLDPKIADRLLDLLSTDDDFRELFSSDPQAALAQVGYLREQQISISRIRTPEEATAKAFDHCCSVSLLASKETILQARQEIKAMLTSGLAYHTPQLDASLTDEQRTLK